MRWLTQDKLYLAAQIPDVQWQPVFVYVGLMGLAGLFAGPGDFTAVSIPNSLHPPQWMPGSRPCDCDMLTVKHTTTVCLMCPHYHVDTTFFALLFT